MKICRKCGFIKSNQYKICPDCKEKLENFEGHEKHYTESDLNV